jgi:hypothetical protein
VQRAAAEIVAQVDDHVLIARLERPLIAARVAGSTTTRRPRASPEIAARRRQRSEARVDVNPVSDARTCERRNDGDPSQFAVFRTLPS